MAPTVNKMVELFTGRLRISDLVLDDLQNHHELLSDSTVMYYLQDIQTKNIEESRDDLLSAINDQTSKERKFYFFKIENMKTAKFIGEIGYTVKEFTPYGKLVHLGYFINQSHWNKGYTTEAVKRIIEFAFNENDVYRIQTGCIKDNSFSEKIMQKCGFIKEAEYKEFVFHDGKLKDRVEYRLLKSEWGNISS